MRRLLGALVDERQRGAPHGFRAANPQVAGHLADDNLWATPMCTLRAPRLTMVATVTGVPSVAPLRVNGILVEKKRPVPRHRANRSISLKILIPERRHMSDAVTFRIEVPEQGFDQTYQGDEVRDFFEAERKFIHGLSPALQQQVQWGNTAYSAPGAYQVALQELASIQKEVEKGTSEKFDDYIASARRLELIIGQGVLGKRITELMSDRKANEAAWTFYIFSSKWIHRTDSDSSPLDRLLSPIRAGVIGNPMFAAFRDVAAVTRALNAVEEARRVSHETSERIEEFYNDKSKVFGELEDLYRRKIPVEEAAVYWERSAKAMTVEWWIWLGLFAGLTLLPVAVGVCNWERIATEIVRVTAAGGSISLGGVAAVTVPVVFYLWLLKHIGRVFQQRLMLADDAAHRRVLTMTYLGLAKESRLSITESERAIILNALFRPIPRSATDDGPPSGLLDLIRKPGPP
jgi:hypothetical protein